MRRSSSSRIRLDLVEGQVELGGEDLGRDRFPSSRDLAHREVLNPPFVGLENRDAFSSLFASRWTIGRNNHSGTGTMCRPTPKRILSNTFRLLCSIRVRNDYIICTLARISSGRLFVHRLESVFRADLDAYAVTCAGLWIYDMNWFPHRAPRLPSQSTYTETPASRSANSKSQPYGVSAGIVVGSPVASSTTEP